MRKVASLIVLSLACCAHRALAQSTIFTYQGRLSANGAPANGLYDFVFTIYKVQTNGLIIAGPLTNAAVAVTNGLFTTPLDFGNQPFLGINRYLDVAVRTNGSTGAFSALSPRVRIASAPYAISAANVIDGAVTAAALSPGPGADGQVLKMSGGVLAWATDTGGGTVTSVGTGAGLLGGPIVTSGTVSLDTTIVPLLNGNQTFTGSNIFNGVSLFSNANNKFTGAFFGNGAGLSNIVATATNGTVTLGGDVTGPSAATTVARLRGVNVVPTAPISGQLLRFSGTDWTPAPVALGTDVTGTLADARLSSNVPLLNSNQTFTGVNTFSGINFVTNLNNRVGGVFTGNGANLTTLNAANISSGALADARLSGNVPLLNGNQTFAGSNTFNGVSSLNNANNRFTGAFVGDGSGLTNLIVTSTNTSITLGGDVTGPSAANTVARIRAVNVSATAPISGQLLRFNGTNWAPGAVALATDASGTLALANGGTAASTAAGARANLNAASSGANADITSLSGLSTPLAVSEGGSGLSSYAAGDTLFASTPTTLSRLADVAAGSALISGGIGVAPLWGKIGLGTHISGTLATVNGGTGSSTLSGARSNLGAAASGANSDITSLTGLTTPLAVSEGGSGSSTYATGDLLYASAANTLARLAIGTNGQALLVSNAIPAWAAANNHNHFGQVWSGVATDGLFLQNTSVVAGASAITASSLATTDIAFGVFGQTASSSGVGVEGFAYATNGLSVGVFGESTSTNGTGVYGFGSASSGQPIGVYGESDSPLGIGIYGIGAATNGTPVGIYGTCSTAGGYGLYTPNRLYVGDSATILGVLTVGTLNAASISGSNFNSLNATSIISGTLSDARLSSNVALRNATQAFTGTNTFSPSAGAPFAVGSTNRVLNLNADLLDGLNGSQFLRSDASSTLSGGNLSLAAGSKLLGDAGSAAAPGIAFATSTTTGLFSPATNTAGISTAGVERMRVASDGKIGLGRTPTANVLEVEGTASKTAAGGWLANSDARIKTDVQNLDHALDTIERVRPVSFKYTEEYRAAHPSLDDKSYYNVIAQEFAKVFPEAVKQSGETLNGSPILQVDIHPAAIYAIAAIKELHSLVKTKDAELLKLRENNEALQKRLEVLEKAVSNLQR